MSNIDRVRELTEDLPGIPKLSELVRSTNTGTHSIIYDVNKGTSFGFNLLSREQYGVMELFVSKGTPFPNHVHDTEIEHYIITIGKIRFTVDNKEVILGVGDHIKLKAGIAHASQALEDTWMIAIGIPRISGYPQ